MPDACLMELKFRCVGMYSFWKPWGESLFYLIHLLEAYDISWYMVPCFSYTYACGGSRLIYLIFIGWTHLRCCIPTSMRGSPLGLRTHGSDGTVWFLYHISPSQTLQSWSHMCNSL